MRPYLAILRDSFREAATSRTLPFLLVFFTIVLLALAPIGLQEDVPWRLTLDEISDQTLWLVKLRSQAQAESDSPGKRLIERMPNKATSRLGLGTPPAPPAVTGFDAVVLLMTSINQEVLPDRTFYSEEAWVNLPLPQEARDFAKRGANALSEDEVKRFNRLLLTAAYPGSLKNPPESRAKVTYAGFEISGFMESILSDSDLLRRLVRQAIYAICVWGIGPIGLLVGIIVTADVMPRTFEPGAIDLLLSKPVSRGLVFVTKFLGACAFILISFTYLVFGLWLIFWLRLDVWAPQILAVIPLFLFSFAVIYAVSAVTGLLWRSPIVAVLVTVLIWGAAFLLGFTRDVMGSLREADRVRHIASVESVYLVSDFNRSSFLWEESVEDWKSRSDIVPPLRNQAASNPLLRPQIIGPVYDQKNDRIFLAEVGATGSNILRVGTAEKDWRTSEGVRLPPGTKDLFVSTEGTFHAFGRAGLFEFRGDPTTQKKEFKIFGVLDLIPDDVENAFVRVDDSSRTWSEQAVLALDSAGKTAIAYDEGLVVILSRNEEGKFHKSSERRLEKVEKAPPAIVAISGSTGLVATKQGVIYVLNFDNLETISQTEPFGDELPKAAISSPDAHWIAVLFHDGQVWIYDVEKQSRLTANPTGQGDISAIAFNQQGNFLVADQLRRLSEYSLPQMELVNRVSGSQPTSELVYRYAITPLTYLLPDTYGLRSVYQYLFTDLKSESMTGDEDDLQSLRSRLNLRRPLVQNALFLCVVLGLASLYVTRKDF